LLGWETIFSAVKNYVAYFDRACEANVNHDQIVHKKNCSSAPFSRGLDVFQFEVQNPGELADGK
jgi:hypothetical protein